MANEFHAMNVVNRYEGNDVELIIPPDDLTGYVTPEFQGPDGRYKIVLFQPTGDERHVALGKFMDAWSKVEMNIRLILSVLIDTDNETMPTVMNALGTRGQLDVMLSLAHVKLTAQANIEIEALLERIKVNNTKRNYIVHGYWALEFKLVSQGNKPGLVHRQYRVYDPSGIPLPKGAAEQAESAKYRFSIPRINSLTTELMRIWTDLGAFMNKHIGANTTAFREADRSGGRLWFLDPGHPVASFAPPDARK